MTRRFLAAVLATRLAACSPGSPSDASKSPVEGGPPIEAGRDTGGRASRAGATTTNDADTDGGAGRADATTTGDATEPCAGTPCRGACIAGRCLVTLTPSPAPSAIALDDAHAYFTSCARDGSGVVSRVALAGGPGVPLATFSECPRGVAAGDDGVYTALGGSGIVRVPLAGGIVTGIAVSEAAPIGVAIDDVNVYFTMPGAVSLVPRGGGAIVTLATVAETRTTRPVLDSENVYWGDAVTGMIHRVPKQGGAAAALAPRVATVRDLTLLGSDVYFAGGYVVQKLPTSGGTPTTLGTAAGAEVLAIAADEAGVYFSSSGAIWKLPLDGGTSVALASGQDEPVAIAVDATSVYWVSRKPDGDPTGCCGRITKLTPK